MTGEDDWRQSGRVNFDTWLAALRQRGATVTEEQADFLREAQRQSFRKHGTPHLEPKPMTNAQRSMKSALIARLRTGLEDLQTLSLVNPGSNPWVKTKDAKKVLDRDAIVEVVKMCADYFGKEYADAIIEAVSQVYVNAGEEIVVQRRVPSQGWGR